METQPVKESKLTNKEYFYQKNTNTFTTKQAFIIVSCIVVAIAFMETSAPVWTLSFLREFGLKLFMYGAVSVIVVVILISSTKIFSDSDDNNKNY